MIPTRLGIIISNKTLPNIIITKKNAFLKTTNNEIEEKYK